MRSWLSWACALVAILGTPLNAARAQEAGQRYALLVGVNRYEHKAELKAPDLKYADGDMAALAGALEAGGFRRDNVVLMTTRSDAGDRLSPRSSNVRKELKSLLARCTPADSVVIAFAGYEKQTRGSDEYYLCTTYARPLNRETMISLSEVYKELAVCKAGLKLVCVDSCRGAEKKDDAEAPQQKAPPAGVATWFACSAGQQAYEHDSLKHGLFTHFIVTGLGGAADSDGDGKVTLAELAPYVAKKVPDYASTHLKVRQAPELIGATEQRRALVATK